MSAELIISIISLASTFILGIFTAFMTFKVKTIEHLESLKKYEKNITNFELQFKDEQWLFGILESGEFDHYNYKSKKRILRWWAEYSKEHIPVLLHPQVDYTKLRLQGLKDIPANVGGKMVEFIGADEEPPEAEDLF